MSDSKAEIVKPSNTAVIADSLRNVVASLGTARDKSTYTTFEDGQDIALNRTIAESMYRFEWPGKIIDIPPYDMTRQWRTWSSESKDPQKIKDIENEEKRLGYKSKVKEALTWAGLYGGCAVIISVDGHGDASIPLDVTKIRKGQLKRLIVVDRWRIFPQPQILSIDPLMPYFGEPENYLMMNSNQIVHSSRLVKFVGREAPFWPKQRLLWWGESKLTRLFDAFRDAGSAVRNIASAIYEANVDIVKMKGLAEALAEEGGEKIKERFELMALMKSINNMILLGDEDEYDRKELHFAGLHQLMGQFMAMLSAASDIPATRLLGKSPEGLNATGEGDLTNYYDMISGHQEDIEPQMSYLDQAMIRSLEGDYPDDLEVEWNPLWQMSEEQKAKLNLDKTQVLLNLQLLGTPDEAILKDIQEEGLSHNLTDDLVKVALEDLEDIDEDDDAKGALENKGDDDEGDESDDGSTT